MMRPIRATLTAFAVIATPHTDDHVLHMSFPRINFFRLFDHIHQTFENLQ
jgi:hypothetical protein